MIRSRGQGADTIESRGQTPGDCVCQPTLTIPIIIDTLEVNESSRVWGGVRCEAAFKVLNGNLIHFSK